MTEEEIEKIKEHIEIHAKQERRAIIITAILRKAVNELEHIAELEKENAELKERETEAEVIIDKFLDFESSAMECGLTLCGDTHKRAVRFLEED